MAGQGGQGPGWHCASHLWGQSFGRVRPHTPPQECGGRYGVGSGCFTLPQ